MREKAAEGRGLYRPEFEHDACGIGAVVDIQGRASHETVDDALKIVEKLEHRAGKDAEGTLPSWMFTPFPMRMELTSPRSTVLNQMLQSRPIFTSPMITALSAKKQFSPISGVKPRTDFISAILISD